MDFRRQARRPAEQPTRHRAAAQHAVEPFSHVSPATRRRSLRGGDELWALEAPPCPSASHAWWRHHQFLLEGVPSLALATLAHPLGWACTLRANELLLGLRHVSSDGKVPYLCTCRWAAGWCRNTFPQLSLFRAIQWRSCTARSHKPCFSGRRCEPAHRRSPMAPTLESRSCRSGRSAA